MLLANEAAKKTREAIRNHQTEELKKIEDGIMKEINSGNSYYAYEGYISPEAKRELKRCGYSVEIGSQYNQGWVRINW